MFIDTSVFVAILAKEPDAAEFAAKIAAARKRYTSGLVRLEAVMRLSTLLDVPPELANEAFDRFLDDADISVVPITGAIAQKAVEAFARFGKGRGHPARLNLADCLSYAAARFYRVSLLYKGGDFTQTDVNDNILS
jgi:ribonuclease VapC